MQVIIIKIINGEYKQIIAIKGSLIIKIKI